MIFRPSNIHRRALCPGSAAAEDGLPEEESKDAAEGVMMHAALSGTLDRNTTILTASQEADVEQARRLAERVIFKTLGSLPPASNQIREKRITLFDDAGDALLSGTPDLICISEDGIVLILDYKLGSIPVIDAEANWQLACYAVAAAELYEARGVFTAIVQPRGYHGASPYTIARFECPHDVQKVKSAILQIVALAQAPDASRRPSLDACRHCKARGTDRCPESQRIVTELTEPFMPDSDRLEGPALMSAIRERIAAATPVEIGELLVKCDLAEKIKLAVERRAKKMLENGELVAFQEWTWGLSKERNRREVVNPRLAIQRLAEASNGVFTAADYAASSTPRVTDLDARWRVITGMKTDDSKAHMAAALGDAMEVKPTQPSLIKERRKKQLPEKVK